MSNLQKTSFKTYGKSNKYCNLELLIEEEIIDNHNYYIMKLNLDYLKNINLNYLKTNLCHL